MLDPELVRAYGPLIAAAFAAYIAYRVAMLVEEQRKRTARSELRKAALAKMLPILRTALMAANGYVNAVWELRYSNSEEPEKLVDRVNQLERERLAAIQQVLGFAAEYGKLPPGVRANHRHLIDHAQRWGFFTAVSSLNLGEAGKVTSQFRSDILALYEQEEDLTDCVGKPRNWKRVYERAIHTSWIRPRDELVIHTEAEPTKVVTLSAKKQDAVNAEESPESVSVTQV